MSKFSAKNWQELGFTDNTAAFEYLDRDPEGFYTLLTDSFNSGKEVPLPWQRFMRGQQSEKSARTAVRNCLKSNSGRRGVPQINLEEFISSEDQKKISDLRKRLAKLQEAALAAAKATKAKVDAQKRILEIAKEAGLNVKIE